MLRHLYSRLIASSMLSATGARGIIVLISLSSIATDRWVVAALLVYDAIITSGVEVDVIWRRRHGVHIVLHVINRYAMIASQISLSTTFFPVSDKVRSILHYIQVAGRVSLRSHGAASPRLTGRTGVSPRFCFLRRTNDD